MAIVIDDRLNLKNSVITGLFEPRQAEPAGAEPRGGAVNPAASAYTPFPSPNGASPLPASPYPQPAPFAAPFPSPGYSPSAPHPVRRKPLTETEMAQERISTILSLNGAGGWIRDVEYNNFYFFYTDVVNKKPDDLAVGMTLQFRLKFDRIKTEQKDNGEPSYRAIGPIYAVD